MSKIDALYEAAQKATPGPREHRGERLSGMLVARDTGTIIVDPYGPNPQDRDLFILADRETVMALIDVYRAANVRTVKQAGGDYTFTPAYPDTAAYPDTTWREPVALAALSDLDALRAAIEKVSNL